MPSIKKKVAGFIRQFSSSDSKENSRERVRGRGGPGRSRRVSSPPPLRSEKCFIQRYLGGESRPQAPAIQYGKTGYQLPCQQVGKLNPEVFAAFTGPAGGITCIKRNVLTEETKKPEDIDYIDLDGLGKVVSRRPSINEALEKMESTTISSVASTPNCNEGRQQSKMKESKPKVLKSPTFSLIDNTVMNIRVGDRIYKVDSSKKSSIDPSTSRDTTSTEASDQRTPLSKTSEIIDIDAELDLVETEDGFVPAGSLSVEEESEHISRKRVTIKSPAKTGVRPSSLNLASGSCQSFSSLSSRGSHGSPGLDSVNMMQSPGRTDQGPQSLPARPGPGSSPPRHSKQSQSKVKTPVSRPKSNYQELDGNVPTTTPTCHQLNDTTDIENKLKIDLKDDISTPIAGIRYWNRPNSSAYGLSESLYERHPLTGEPAGSPIADTFAVIARKNSAILVLGDGVNWGAKAALASRAAVYGAMEYLNSAVFGVSRSRALSTQDVFQILLRSFHAAHCLILEEEAMLTTLTAAVVLPTYDESSGAEKFHLCVCNVGDSLAYVYQAASGQVREVTLGSHDITTNRDMRDALGALGPVDGLNPELSNLTCSITEVLPGDIVFVTSDGISDNFDPVVGKFCVPKKPERSGTNGASQSKSGSSRQSQTPTRHRAQSEFDSLPTVEAFQRHELTLARIEDILNEGSGSLPGGIDSIEANAGRVRTPSELCHRMLDFCQRLTTAKRKILEDPELYPRPEDGPDQVDQKVRRRRVCEKLALVPGKLDHATIVAYQVEDRTEELQDYTGDTLSPCPALSSSLTMAAPHASCEDLTMKDSPEEFSDSQTPTLSISLASTPFGSGYSSLAATPTHTVNPIVCQQ